jgi:hypothetical protein
METAQLMVEAVERGVKDVVATHGLEGKHVGTDMTIRMAMDFFNPQKSSPNRHDHAEPKAPTRRFRQ